MKVSSQLEFNFADMQGDIHALVGNAEMQFYDFYISITLMDLVDIRSLCKYVFEQVLKTGRGTFIAKKDDIPFEVVINWQKSQVDIQSIEGQKEADLVFYVERCLEICSNFAMFELEASEDGSHTMGERWTKF